MINRNQYQRTYQQQRRAVAEEEGRCVQCCANPAREGRKSCADCAEKARMYQQQRPDVFREAKRRWKLRTRPAVGCEAAQDDVCCP